MSIRLRLLIILLVTALTPLVITSLAHQISIRIAEHQLTAIVRKNLDTNARRALQELHQAHVALLQKDTQLTEVLLASQAREIQKALSQCSQVTEARVEEDTFGYDPNIALATDAYHPYFQDINDPNITNLHIDYQRQRFFTAPDANPNQVKLVLNGMGPLTKVFHTLYQQAPKGVLWMSTSFQQFKIFTRYPAGQTVRIQQNTRSNPSPQRRPPSRNPNPNRSGSQNRPKRRDRPPIRIMPDRTTNQWVMVSDTKVSSDDGTITGVTSLARTIPEVFEDVTPPERWGQETEHILIRLDPNNPDRPSADKLVHNKLVEFDRAKWRQYRRTPLTSRNTEAFKVMIANLLAGQAGTQLMDYNGRQCMWAYQPAELASVAVILIVPYDRITELAATMGKSLIQESMFWLEITTVVLILAAAFATILAFAKARTLTEPISTLIHAGRQLAAGNYEAQVHSMANDELGQLGKVFNDIGPKLQERETLKQSLELARAVQQSLLPKKTPNLQCFDVAGQCLYCDETGGDYYDFIDLSGIHPQKCSIVLGDVSGHGIGTALLMASVRGIMHSEVKHSACDLVKLLNNLNQQVIEDTDDDKFVTLFHGILDDRNRSFTWSSAGHEPAYWYHKDKNAFEELPNTGMPIGIIPDAVFEQAGPLSPKTGDLIIIGTDGIWEARNEYNQFFGKERFCKTIEDHAQDTAQELCAAVIDEVTAFIGPGARTDDITLIVIKTV